MIPDTQIRVDGETYQKLKDLKAQTDITIIKLIKRAVELLEKKLKNRP